MSLEHIWKPATTIDPDTNTVVVKTLEDADVMLDPAPEFIS